MTDLKTQRMCVCVCVLFLFCLFKLLLNPFFLSEKRFLYGAYTNGRNPQKTSGSQLSSFFSSSFFLCVPNCLSSLLQFTPLACSFPFLSLTSLSPKIKKPRVTFFFCACLSRLRSSGALLLLFVSPSESSNGESQASKSRNGRRAAAAGP